MRSINLRSGTILGLFSILAFGCVSNEELEVEQSGGDVHDDSYEYDEDLGEILAAANCTLIDVPESSYTPMSTYSSEYGSARAIAIGDRESCRAACAAWRGPQQKPNREWDHRAMHYYDDTFTYLNPWNGIEAEANVVCMANLWAPNAAAIGAPRLPWTCPVLPAQPKKIYTTVFDGKTESRILLGVEYTARGSYACDEDLNWGIWSVNVN